MDDEYFKNPHRLPLNVSGPWYTTGQRSSSPASGDSELEWVGDCLWCGTPEYEAPTLLAPFDETYTETHFVRQPLISREVEQAIQAAKVCCTNGT